MTIRRKSIGSIIGVICVLSTSSASAAEFHLGLPLTGAQSTGHVFTTIAGTVTCKVVHANGVASTGTTSELTLTPKYENCTAFAFINVPIDVNGCIYRLTVDGVTHLECPTEKQIEITAPFCTTKIGPQTASGSSFANNATKTDVVVTMNISGISYDECGTKRTNATYTGTTTLTSSGNIWFE